MPLNVTGVRSPVVWFGGKGRMIGSIIPVFETIDHKRYVEPFGGGGSVLLMKPPVGLEVYNDIDDGVYNFFKVLSEPELFKSFLRRVDACPYSRKLYEDSLKTWRHEEDPAVKAVKWFVVVRQSFGGRFGSGWGFVSSFRPDNRHGVTHTCFQWRSAIDKLEDVVARLMRVQIENDDFRKVIERYDTSDTLFYCDPPYVLSTRKSGGYGFEMSDDDHRDLVSMLMKVKAKVVLSGYQNDIYKALDDSGWSRIDFEKSCDVAGRTKTSSLQGSGSAYRGQKRVDSLWVSPGAQTRNFQLGLFAKEI